MIDLKDPDNTLYIWCAMAATAILLAGTVVSLVYIVVAAPSEAYALTSGDDSPGVAYPVICGIILLACLALLIRDLLKRTRGRPRGERLLGFMDSPICKAGMLCAVISFTTVVILLFSSLIGEEITESFLDDMTDYELMVSMMIAGPEEEITCRALIIGLPMVLICAIKGHKGCAKDILGGFGMSRAALVLLVISSAFFGALHLSGWSIMKFPDTFIAGMVFGYVYIQYGLHASIFAHSAFDMIASFDMFVEGSGTALVVTLAVLGVVLFVRSMLKFRDYLPSENLHEPFGGSLIEMWERDRRS